MRRRVIIAFGVLAFLVIAFEAARFLTAENVERSAVFALLEDQARGDTVAVTAALEGCTRQCADRVARTVRSARRPGEVKILRFDAANRFSLGRSTGRSRVAWAVDVASGSEAVVQCVTVRRDWSLISGASVTLQRLSAPLPPEKGC
ncbi:MAG: hypothetical protein H0V81_12245 [Solirubrobacterales bacterium]|nr:hypothetical protein [Solirubrobacterales bacterium]